MNITFFSVSFHEDINFPCSFWVQFLILFSRMNLQLLRNKTMIIVQCLHSIISGLLLGSIYIGTGQDGSQTMGIFKYCIAVNVFFMYTYTMMPVLLCEYLQMLIIILIVLETCPHFCIRYFLICKWS